MKNYSMVTIDCEKVSSCFKKIQSACTNSFPDTKARPVQPQICRYKKENGAIAVEYALCMLIAAIFMMGMLTVFEKASIEITAQFIDYVSSFPDNF